MSWHKDQIVKGKNLRKLLRTRRFHYKKAFSGESGEWVIKDIALDARINDGIFSDNQRKQDFDLGYRACVLRMTRILNMTNAQIDQLTQQGAPDDE